MLLSKKEKIKRKIKFFTKKIDFLTFFFKIFEKENNYLKLLENTIFILNLIISVS